MFAKNKNILLSVVFITLAVLDCNLPGDAPSKHKHRFYLPPQPAAGSLSLLPFSSLNHPHLSSLFQSSLLTLAHKIFTKNKNPGMGMPGFFICYTLKNQFSQANIP